MRLKLPYSADRDAEMAWLYQSGLTMQEIGDGVGLSRERVRQLLKRSGVKGRRRSARARNRLALARELALGDPVSIVAARHGLRRGTVVQVTRPFRPSFRPVGMSREEVLAEVMALRQTLGRPPRQVELSARLRGAICSKWRTMAALWTELGWPVAPSSKRRKRGETLALILRAQGHCRATAEIAREVGVSWQCVHSALRLAGLYAGRARP